jgi:excisionase family DNA binding protein
MFAIKWSMSIGFKRYQSKPAASACARLASVNRAVSAIAGNDPIVPDVARILRMSRATLYERIRAGEIKAQKDGRRRYITASELRRYVLAKD